ncbi:MAG: hypothetical protein ACRET2_01515 [Steroidobacteraceae bacterium]
MAKVPVHEVRKLRLPLETAVDAALELDCEQGGALAFGALLEARIESEPEPHLLLVVQRRGTDTVERRKFELPIMAAAFIRYCWKCRIPLPRHGSKSIEVAPDGFVFTIEGTVDVVRRHTALPPSHPVRGAQARRGPAPAAAQGSSPESAGEAIAEPTIDAITAAAAAPDVEPAAV